MSVRRLGLFGSHETVDGLRNNLFFSSHRPRHLYLFRQHALIIRISLAFLLF